MKWDFQVWNEKNPWVTVFYGKKLFTLFGWTFRIHKFVRSDDPECFHTHPAWAFRLILWGGYVEEYTDDEGHQAFATWFPGRFGWVAPDFEHRIDRFLNKRCSYSLWIRGPVIAEVKTRGC